MPAFSRPVLCWLRVRVSVLLYADKHSAPFRANIVAKEKAEPSAEGEIRNSTVSASVIQALDSFALRSGDLRIHFEHLRAFLKAFLAATNATTILSALDFRALLLDGWPDTSLSISNCSALSTAIICVSVSVICVFMANDPEHSTIAYLSMRPILCAMRPTIQNLANCFSHVRLSHR